MVGQAFVCFFNFSCFIETLICIMVGLGNCLSYFSSYLYKCLCVCIGHCHIKTRIYVETCCFDKVKFRRRERWL